MSLSLAVITIGIDPEIRLGPLTLAWHGLTIAIGIGVGAVVAGRWAQERGIDPDPLYTMSALVAIAGLVGGRIFYVAEHGGPLLGTRGFTFDGGVILAAVVLAIYAKRAQVGPRYLDAVAVGLPLGVAIGRVGDVINGEHHGPRSDFFLAVRNSNADALTPDPNLAYHNGGLYEVLLATLIFAVMWSLRNRLRRPGDLAWLVLGLFAAGRFAVFFARSDSPELALGLSNTQWTSLVLLVLIVAGWALTSRRAPRAQGPGPGRSSPPPSPASSRTGQHRGPPS